MTHTVTQPDVVRTPPPTPDPVIELRHVSKSFGALRILDDLSLSLNRGETTVILGPSGTGKSVLLKHIVGLMKPDAGEVWFDGQRIDNLAERELVSVRKRIGLLFQMGALFDSMDVEHNICFPLMEHTRLSAADQRDRCHRVLQMVGLDGVEHKMPSELSGGQRKRVALARAVVLEPDVVLYDEPTTGLDPIRADLINELIATLARELSITSIVVTHDMISANRVADRMVMLYDGTVIADAPKREFIESDNDFVHRFVAGQAEPDDLEAIRRGFSHRRRP